MAVLESEIAFYLSGKADSTNTVTTNSLGGVIATRIPDQVWETSPNTDNTMTPNIQNQVADNGDFLYFCYYLKNENATLELRNIKIFFSKKTPANDKVKMWYSGNMPNTQEQTVIEMIDKPVGSTFTFPYDEATAITLPNLLAGQWVGFWIEIEVPPNTGTWEDNGYELTIFATSNA